ncbi:MAG: hypothetical protein P4L69_17665 [Desulfosporosinus sp.]|nr:hypothetical protein [Desulfosporosinus sp.]
MSPVWGVGMEAIVKDRSAQVQVPVGYKGSSSHLSAGETAIRKITSKAC